MGHAARTKIMRGPVVENKRGERERGILESIDRGVVCGMTGVVSATLAFEKIKGTCTKMLHLKYIFTP